MSLFSSLKTEISSFFADAEADVIKIVGAIAHGVEVAEADLEKALNWIVSEAPAIEQGVATATGFIQAILPVATALSPATAAELTAADAAIGIAAKGFDAAVAAVTAGQAAGTNAAISSAQALTAGYQAVQTARAAVAQAQSAASGVAAQVVAKAS